MIVLLSLSTVYDIKQETLVKISAEKQRYDRILETAVNDAAGDLVTKDRGNKPIIQKEAAVESFFQSLYAGFGILHDEAAKQEINGYIPIILITDRDGFYIWYHGEYEGSLVECFSEKYPYAYSCSDTYVGFTMGETVYVVDGARNLVDYGTRQDILKCVPNLTFLKERSQFEEIRRHTIIYAITEKMNAYLYSYNRIGKRYGMTYQFSIPTLDVDTWARTMDDISIVAFFQGYPYGNHITERYYQYAIKGARVSKKRREGL